MIKEQNQNDLILNQLVLKVFLKSNCVYGYRKIFVVLNRLPNITLWKVRNAYEKLKLKARKTISQKHHRPKEDKTINIQTQNIINRNFKATRANQKWFIDSSVIKLKSGKHLWLCVIIETLANQIVSWKLSHTNDTDLAVATLNLAIDKFGAPEIIHSDHGTPFLSKRFKDILKYNQVIQSVSRVANSLDNRPIEFFFGLLKHEWLYHTELTSLKTADKAINSYVTWYNKDRIQNVLNNMSPEQYLLKYNQLN